MNCHLTNDIHAYVDDRLTAQSRESLESHLAVCSECRRLLAELTRLRAMLLEADLPEISLASLESYRRAFDAARDRDVRRVAGWLTAAAAVLLIAATTMWPEHGGVTPLTATAAWENAAVVPPLEAKDAKDEAQPAQVEMAQWMAEGLGGLARQNVP